MRLCWTRRATRIFDAGEFSQLAACVCVCALFGYVRGNARSFGNAMLATTSEMIVLFIFPPLANLLLPLLLAVGIEVRPISGTQRQTHKHCIRHRGDAIVYLR